jgi:hypothetical protein
MYVYIHVCVCGIYSYCVLFRSLYTCAYTHHIYAHVSTNAPLIRASVEHFVWKAYASSSVNYRTNAIAHTQTPLQVPLAYINTHQSARIHAITCSFCRALHCRGVFFGLEGCEGCPVLVLPDTVYSHSFLQVKDGILNPK